MLKIVQIATLVFATFMLLACVGDREKAHKIVYAATGCFLFVVLFASLIITGVLL